MHVAEINDAVWYPEDGLLIGNGDLSVSLYQKLGELIWRFGKSDAWDRRLDTSCNPRPPDINELAHGIEVEGWKCSPRGWGVEATKGTDNPERMREICQVTPSELKPYPMPKPVGELSLRLLPDLRDLKISQRLFIEEGRIEVICSWDNGTKLTLNCSIHPVLDILIIAWGFENFDLEEYRHEVIVDLTSPLKFSLYRWPDPAFAEYDDRLRAEVSPFPKTAMERFNVLPPLEPPRIEKVGGTHCIEQQFYPDALFPEGFKYRMTPYVSNGSIRPFEMDVLKEARLIIDPSDDALRSGWTAVHVATSMSDGGVEASSETVRSTLNTDSPAVVEAWKRDSLESAKVFWEKSSIETSDKLIENVWYETLHFQRCIFGKCAVPPGLMLPSTLGDYSYWHGDYHSNYNFQSPFWGLYASNHLELAESYYRGIDFFIDVGRKIARDYYHCRGVFMQLSAYPLQAEDDWLGGVPMGRMAYMTGWVPHHYWWHYLHTLDMDFLANRAYPLIRDCALFYADFLKESDDGLYHAFPSNVDEDGFSGNASEYRDRAQVMKHICYLLRTAVKAAEELGVDREYIDLWRERLDKIAPANPIDAISEDALAIGSFDNPLNPPEFGPITLDRLGILRERPLSKPHRFWSYDFGHFPTGAMALLRTQVFEPERDFADFRGVIKRWRCPNGNIPALSINHYAHTGSWCESLGITAPIQEMLMQSWVGFIEVFPAWPTNADASFRHLRAEGAFLVSSSLSNGLITHVDITSEKGGCCRVKSPWRKASVTREPCKQKVEAIMESDGILAINTEAGQEYHLVPA